MSIERVGLVRWKATASERDIEAALGSVLALRDQVPGVLAITAGRNVSPYGSEFTHAFFVRFESRRARDDYDAHRAHRRVIKEVFAPLNEKIVVVDFDPEEYRRSPT